jgi:hypothetical protein
MSDERDKALLYHLDTSGYNELVHQPGRLSFIDRLKRARDEGQAYTFLSRDLLQELVVTYNTDADLGNRFIRTVQSIALRGRLLKDAPELFRQEVNRLVNEKEFTDYLEPLGWQDATKLANLVDEFSEDKPLHPMAQDFVKLQRKKQQDVKDQWRAAWSTFLQSRYNYKKAQIPKTFSEFIARIRAEDGMETLVEMWTPKSLKGVIPAAELARRLDETVSFRAMVYHVSSAFFHKILKTQDGLHGGDYFDARHSVAAANVDVFVCNDEDAGKYASSWCRNGQRVMTLSDFVASLK